MPEQVWYTILGGFISGVVGLVLFFIQRGKQKKDEQQNYLFRIYQIIKQQSEYGYDLRDAREKDRWNEMLSLSLLLKNKKLAIDIYRDCSSPGFSKEDSINAIMQKIAKRLNKRLVRKTNKTWPWFDKFLPSLKRQIRKDNKAQQARKKKEKKKTTP
jgi:hypothetical protein